MALTPSTMLPLGTPAPDFHLMDTVSNEMHSLQNSRGEKATVILFICNHCPYVKHINAELVDTANIYQKKGVTFIAISSNDVDNFPEDGPEKMKKTAEENHYPFAYLYDETQDVAKAYQAACTPDCYIFDADLKCVYRGRFDDATPGNDIPVTGQDLRAALDNIITGHPVSDKQIASIGCNIKWKE